MTTRTPRRNLTAWFAVAVLLIVTPFFVAVLTIHWRSTRAALDHHLDEDLEVAVQFLAWHDGRFEWRRGRQSDDGRDFGYDAGPQRWVEVADSTGRRLFARGVAAEDWVASTLPPIGSNPEPYESVVTPAGASVRLRSARRTIDGRSVFVRVARWENEIRAEWRRLAILFGATVPLATLAAAIAGYLLAGRALAPIQDSVDRLARFTADASHELRTPLTAIRSVGEVGLRDPRSAADYREIIGSMLEDAGRLTALVDSLLALARYDGRRVGLPERLDLGDLTHEAVDQLGILAEERRIVLNVAAPPGAVVRGDRASLRQAVLNVVDNAIKYSPDGGRVDVSVRRSGGTCEIEVSDQGPGIAEADLERIFDRFYRVDAARGREIEGVGLGLSIARRAVEANGGRIAARSDGTHGSRFTIFLPGAPAPIH